MLRLVLLSLVLASSSAMGGKERIKRNIQKWNDDVACWGRENMLAWEVAKMKAIQQCTDFGLATSLPSLTTNPFSPLPRLVQNPWTNVPTPIKRVNPLQSSVSGSSGSLPSQQQWTDLWADFLSMRSKRQVEDEDEEEENSEEDTEEEIMEFIENYAEFKQDMGSRIGNLTCVLTKLDMLDSALQVNLDFFLTDVWKQLDLSKSLAGRDAAWVHKVTQGYSD